MRAPHQFCLAPDAKAKIPMEQHAAVIEFEKQSLAKLSNK